MRQRRAVGRRLVTPAFAEMTFWYFGGGKDGNGPMTSFLQSRWLGEVPLETVFWRDMLLVGSLLNMAAAAAAYAMIAADYPGLLAMLVFVLPLPWNLFLLVAVWQSADRDGGAAALTAKVISVIWLVAMFVV